MGKGEGGGGGREAFSYPLVCRFLLGDGQNRNFASVLAWEVRTGACETEHPAVVHSNSYVHDCP